MYDEDVRRQIAITNLMPKSAFGGYLNRNVNAERVLRRFAASLYCSRTASTQGHTCIGSAGGVLRIVCCRFRGVFRVVRGVNGFAGPTAVNIDGRSSNHP